MQQRYVENKTADVKYVGGYMIAPHSGRHIPAAGLLAESAAEPGISEPAAGTLPPAEMLLEQSVKSVESVLHLLNIDQIFELQQLESASARPRKTLLESMAKEILEQAAN